MYKVKTSESTTVKECAVIDTAQNAARVMSRNGPTCIIVEDGARGGASAVLGMAVKGELREALRCDNCQASRVSSCWKCVCGYVPKAV